MQVMPKQNSTIKQHKDHRIPNIYWRSVSTDLLRCQERYVALPPVATLPSTEGPISYRYVRQDSPLWSQLHDGMLTTGRLKQALGMHEAKAAQVVGIHPGSRGPSYLLSAYFHLLNTNSSSSSSSSSTATTAADVAAAAAAAAASNEETRQLFNQRLAAEGLALDSSSCSSSSSLSTAAALQQWCERTALSGDVAVKLAWGKVQEAAALYSLLQLFPEALLEEVGLFELDTASLPPSWFPEPSSKTLPRLGASPDGLIVHKLTFTAEDVQAVARLSVTDEVTQQAAVQKLLEKALDAVPCKGTRPHRGVAVASSSEEEEEQDEGNETELQGEGDSSDGEIQHAGGDEDGSNSNGGGSSSSSSSRRKNASKLADVQSTTDAHDAAGSIASGLGKLVIPAEAGARQTPAAAAANGAAAAAGGVSVQAAGSLRFEPVGVALLQLLQQQQQQPSSSSSSSSNSAGPVTVYMREVVEVKNHCPFAFRAKRKGKKGRVHVSYSFRPRGPAGRVHPQWVPQLQMHMLAAGCQSALLVSRCPDQGVRVFRLWRDDTYLQTMLRLLALLQANHVLTGLQPSAATFTGVPGYKAFLHRTAALARSAVCVAAAGEDVVGCVPAAAGADGSLPLNVPKFW